MIFTDLLVSKPKAWCRHLMLNKDSPGHRLILRSHGVPDQTHSHIPHLIARSLNHRLHGHPVTCRPSSTLFDALRLRDVFDSLQKFRESFEWELTFLGLRLLQNIHPGRFFVKIFIVVLQRSCSVCGKEIENQRASNLDSLLFLADNSLNTPPDISTAYFRRSPQRVIGSLWSFSRVR